MNQNEKTIEDIKTLVKTKKEFIEEIRQYILKQNDFSTVQNIICLLHTQNFDLNEFDIPDRCSETSVLSLMLAREDTPQNFGTEVWSYFENNKYLFEAPDPELPNAWLFLGQSLTVLESPIIGAIPDELYYE